MQKCQQFTIYFEFFKLLYKDVMENFVGSFGEVRIKDCESVNRLIVLLTLDGI